jgi:hypothetical protein
VVEYEGRLLLENAAKDYVGYVFVSVCAAAAVFSMLLIYEEFVRLLHMHRILFLKSWILDLSVRLGAAGTEGVYLSLVAAVFNKVAAADIYNSKQNMRLELENFKLTLTQTRSRIVSFFASIRLWFFKQRLSFTARQYKPSPEVVDECIKAPEIQVLFYLHKLSERVERWEQVSSDYFDVNPAELPKEFREVKGDADPPHAEYAYQTNVIHMLEDALPARVHRVLAALMFSYFTCATRPDASPSEMQ